MRLRVLFPVSLLVLAIAAQDKVAPRKFRFTFVLNTESPFWEPMKAGLRKAAQETGWELDVQSPRNANAEEQISIVEGLIARGVDGICISPLNDKALQRVLQRAQKAGIEVVCMDSDAPGSGRAFYMGTSNFTAGRAAGEALKKVLPAGGKVGAFVGTMTAANAQERWRGVKDACQGSKITFLGDPDQDSGDANKAQDNVRDQLQHHQDLAGVLGIYSYNGPAAARAVKAADKIGKVRIVAFDDEPQTLEFLEQGVIDVAIAQRPWRWGHEIPALLGRLKTEGRDKVLASLKDTVDKNGVLDTGVETITRESVKGYRENLKKLLGK
jgi:ribose transport system substrate-binding protein